MSARVRARTAQQAAGTRAAAAAAADYAASDAAGSEAEEISIVPAPETELIPSDDDMTIAAALGFTSEGLAAPVL